MSSGVPFCRFILDEDLTTADPKGYAYITNQWGPGIMHAYHNKIVVVNPETSEEGVYFFSGEKDEVGLAVWNEGENWVIVSMEDMAAQWYIGKVTGSDIVSETCGTVVQHECGWTATTNEFNVYNPHDVDLPVDLKVRWGKYPGWVSCGACVTDLIVEPWHWTEC
jgi:hypothetical protein